MIATSLMLLFKWYFDYPVCAFLMMRVFKLVKKEEMRVKWIFISCDMILNFIDVT